MGDAQLDAAFEAARAAACERDGDLGVPATDLAADFKARVLERAGATGASISEVLAATRGDDLYLALAWQHGSQAAWSIFSERYEQGLVAAAQGQGAGLEQARDLAQGLPGQLIAEDTLTRYQGRGSLRGWLKVMVQRRVIDGARRSATEQDLGSVVHEAQTPAGDADLGAMERETTQKLITAAHALAESLTPKESLVLQFKYRDGLPQRTIARLLSVSDSRVTRLVGQGSEKLAAQLRRTFPGGRPEPFPGLDALWRTLGNFQVDRQDPALPPDHGADPPTAGTP
ncbi:MAG: sigma-70 family RNA polymerase sigma factor [Planctomycetota bacterium]|nr:sigma-70 family RNA polymerase sigma factor [Planctomycetota bacterium]